MLGVLGAVVLAACMSGDGGGGTGSDEVRGRVTVLAAASLTDALEDVAGAFETAHPGVEVALSFDGSSALATQILEGAPADVFASADEVNLAKVVDGGAATGPTVTFATGSLAIVVAAGNPLGIDRLEDLSGDLRLALCAREVPCGAYAVDAFRSAGLLAPAASAEENVRGVLTKVALGEADAGIVYTTDVGTDPHVEGVEIPAAHQVTALYPATVLADAPNPPAAAAFVAFLTADVAQGILASHGFGSP